MRPSWVAGSTRARLLAGRRLGPEGIRPLAGADGLSEALALLDGTTYAPAAAAATLEDAERALAAVVLFELRLLLGWLPSSGRGLARSLGAWFELVNVEDRLAYLRGGPLLPPFELGALASAWPRARAAGSPAELRETLRASAWGDPGGDEVAALHVGLRLAWARRLREQAPETRAWVGGALALLLARGLVEGGRPAGAARSAALRDLGERWQAANTIEELGRVLPPHAGWVLQDAGDAADLWRLETAWWRRVGREAEALAHAARDGRAVVVGSVALLALDAVRIAAALAAAAAQDEAAREVVDALL